MPGASRSGPFVAKLSRESERGGPLACQFIQDQSDPRAQDQRAGGVVKATWLGLLAALTLAACASTGNLACDQRTSTREARYANGDVQLAAAWITPASMYRAPAVVILQGSGESDRSNAWAASIANALARCGVAVLLTDKRGVGASGGEWRTSSMLDLAADGAAGMQWIAAQEGVDRGRLGFLGLSQGGQVAPAAATLSPDADFVIGWVTSVGPMKNTLLYELEQTYRQRGLDAAQIETLQQMARSSFGWLETGQGWDHYIAQRTRIAAGPLAPAVESWPDDQQDPYWIFWRANGPYDPLPYWRNAVGRHGLPALVVLGADDARDNVDVATTERLLRAVEGLQVEVLPGVGHSLQLRSGDFHPRALEATLAHIRR